MTYRVILKADGEEYDSRPAETDQELFQAIGKFAVYYWLALEVADYEDASWHSGDQTDPKAIILDFTAHKASDEPGKPHRHGLKTGMFGYGVCYIGGEKKDAHIYVEEVTE